MHRRQRLHHACIAFACSPVASSSLRYLLSSLLSSGLFFSWFVESWRRRACDAPPLLQGVTRWGVGAGAAPPALPVHFDDLPLRAGLGARRGAAIPIIATLCIQGLAYAFFLPGRGRRSCLGCRVSRSKRKRPYHLPCGVHLRKFEEGPRGPGSGCLIPPSGTRTDFPRSSGLGRADRPRHTLVPRARMNVQSAAGVAPAGQAASPRGEGAGKNSSELGRSSGPPRPTLMGDRPAHTPLSALTADPLSAPCGLRPVWMQVLQYLSGGRRGASRFWASGRLCHRVMV